MDHRLSAVWRGANTARYYAERIAGPCGAGTRMTRSSLCRSWRMFSQSARHQAEGAPAFENAEITHAGSGVVDGGIDFGLEGECLAG